MEQNLNALYLTIDEAADYLRLKKTTLYSFVHQRRNAHRKHGSRLGFVKQDLDAFSESGERKILERKRLTF